MARPTREPVAALCRSGHLFKLEPAIGDEHVVSLLDDNTKKPSFERTAWRSFGGAASF